MAASSTPSPKAEDPPENLPPSALRSRGWWWRFSLSGILLIILWLFWSVHPPAGLLLDQMPADLPVGIEIRSPKTFWQNLLASRAWAELRETPLGDVREEIDTAFGLGWGLSGRALNGAWAVAMRDGQMLDGVILGHIDHAGMLALRWYLWRNGQVTADGAVSYVKIPLNERTVYLTYANDLVIGAFSLKRLAKTLATWSTSPDKKNALALPPAGVIMRTGKDMVWAEWGGQNAASWLRDLEAGMLIASVTKAGGEFTFTGELSPTSFPPKIQPSVTKTRGDAAMVMRDLSVPATKSGLWVSGLVREDFFWRLLSESVWGKIGRPQRGPSHPLAVLAWEWFDAGVIRHADGRFSISLNSPPKIKEGQGIPALPRMDFRWGVTDAVVAQKDFLAGMRGIVHYYRAPGGSAMYEDVREDTRLVETAEGNGFLRLQPLFFNHLTPGWKIAGAAGYFSTAWNANESPAILAPPQRDSSSPQMSWAGTLIDMDFGWTRDCEILTAVRAVAKHKIVDHAYVQSTRKQITVMRGVDAVLLPFNEIAAAQGRIHLARKATPAGGFSYPIKIKLRLSLSVKSER